MEVEGKSTASGINKEFLPHADTFRRDVGSKLASAHTGLVQASRERYECK